MKNHLIVILITSIFFVFANCKEKNPQSPSNISPNMPCSCKAANKCWYLPESTLSGPEALSYCQSLKGFNLPTKKQLEAHRQDENGCLGEGVNYLATEKERYFLANFSPAGGDAIDEVAINELKQIKADDDENALNAICVK